MNKSIHWLSPQSSCLKKKHFSELNISSQDQFAEGAKVLATALQPLKQASTSHAFMSSERISERCLLKTKTWKVFFTCDAIVPQSNLDRMGGLGNNS